MCRVLCVALTLLGFTAARADDPPQLRKTGEIVVKFVKVSDNSITVKIPEPQKGGKKGQIKLVDKDREFDMAGKVTVRYHHLPKGPDGKTRQYTPEEIGKLREPVTLPGYQADLKDLKGGMVVKLTFGKSDPKADPVVMAIMIEVEAPPPKPDAKGKAKS